MTSEEIKKAIQDAEDNETVISTDVAVAIARGWQAPDNDFSAFAHGYEVGVYSFHQEVEYELTRTPYGDEWNQLSALLSYIENATMGA